MGKGAPGQGGAQSVTRNLTSLYTRYRNDRPGARTRTGLGAISNSGQRLLSSGEDPRGAGGGEMLEMSALPPQWMDCAEEAREDLKSIREKIVQLKKAQQARILNVFGDDAAPDKETEAIASQISQLVRRCESSIHQVKTKGGVSSCATDAEIRQNVQRNLATELQQVSQQFRQGQKELLNEMRKRQRGTDWDDATMGSSGQGGDVGFNDAQVFELEHMETQASQRSNEICQIASSINDLHTIFKELAVLVIDQGTILDRIDYNIEQVVVQSREANVQLQKAEKAQKSNRAMKCIILLVVINLILIIILIIKARH